MSRCSCASHPYDAAHVCPDAEAYAFGVSLRWPTEKAEKDAALRAYRDAVSRRENREDAYAILRARWNEADLLTRAVAASYVQGSL